MSQTTRPETPEERRKRQADDYARWRLLAFQAALDTATRAALDKAGVTLG